MSKRLVAHRSDYNRKINDKSKKILTSSKIIENGDYQIVLIENLICNNKNELLQRERHYIDTLDCVNKKRQLRTKADWDIDNTDYNKNWRDTNKEKIQEYFQN